MVHSEALLEENQMQSVQDVMAFNDWDILCGCTQIVMSNSFFFNLIFETIVRRS